MKNFNSNYSRTAVTLIGFLFLSFLLAGNVLAVTCCKCATKDDPKTNICIKTVEQDCTKMPSKSDNVDVKALNCTESLGLPDQGKCRAVSGGGICVEGPAEEFTYKPAARQEEVTHPAGVYSHTLPVTPPKLGVAIPGLEFSKRVVAKAGYFEIPFIAEYIAAIYKFLVGLSIVAAAIMITWGGFRYLTGASVGGVQRGKEIIRDALIGLVLVLGSFVILSTFNEELVSLKGIRVEAITGDFDFFYKDGVGTGIPHASDDAIKEQESKEVPGTPGTTKTYPSLATPPSPGQTQVPQPVTPGVTPPSPGQTPVSSPTPSTQPGLTQVPPPVVDEIVDLVDLTSITEMVEKREKDKKKDPPGAAELLNFYCTPKDEAEIATSYEDKIKLLVKATMGFFKVCIEEKMCVYCQTCSTVIPTGSIGKPLPSVSFAVDFAVAHGYTPPSGVWDDIDCNSRYEKRGKYSSDKNRLGYDPVEGPKSRLVLLQEKPSCLVEPQAVYERYVQDIMKAKYFAGDCGTFTRAIYGCANAKKQSTPTVTRQGKKTAYLDGGAIEEVKDLPMTILASTMDKDLNALAAKKGGLKFGDMVYTCCGGKPGTYSAHWALYTGGRPDVPFSFIEMGGSQPPPGKGGSIKVPNVGGIIGGVVIRPKGWTIQDYVNMFTQKKPLLYVPSGKIWGYGPGTHDPKRGLVFVFRPYADQSLVE